MIPLNFVLYPLLGYLLGSLPFALWVTRRVTGADVRAAGSGHVGTTNTIRQAGWVAGVVVLLLDIGKGFLPVHLALRAGMPVWVIALTAGLAVVGHCWPVFAGFRGGMGLATTAGALLAVSLLVFLVSFAVLLLAVLILRHAARGAVVAAVLAPPLAWALGLRGVEFWVGLAVAPVLALRFFIEDWNRQYRELWLDREE